MVKVRMNTADVAAEVKCLRRLIGMRCANVYDLNPKTYMFKLMNSSGVTESGESEKVLLLMESGVRLHTTAYVRDKNTTPSGFTLKLRKHIRARRLEDVRQLGYDRVILFQFGLGANANFVILELYAQGNILLTDSDYVVMTLLRSHRDDDKGLAIMSRHCYPIESCRVFARTNLNKLQATLASLEETENDGNELNGTEMPKIDAQGSTLQLKQQVTPPSTKHLNSNKKENGGDQGKKLTLKAILGDSLGYGPALSEHIILDAGLLPNMKIGGAISVALSGDAIHALASAVRKFEDWLEDVISGESETIPEGYILMQKGPPRKTRDLPPDDISQNKVYDEFCPILLNQFKSREFVRMDTFDAALDEFYSKIESQRAEQQQRIKEDSAVQKLTKIRTDQENRVHALKKEVDHALTIAQLIEYNLQEVEAAIVAVRVELANGMNWEDLARMVKEEKKSGNPIAGLIDKLHLERNYITLLLSNNLDEMDDDEKTSPAYKVAVDLALSAHANARRWFELKKRQENKQEKTITAHEKAFKAAERKTKQQLLQEKSTAAISHMRKVHWFEKFNWFISSENYLIISGRDAQQNEMVVKRYMSKGDIYVHADLHGASSTIIKNHNPDLAIPPLSLNQAGCFTVCQSQAWESKMVTSAWWVYPHQVSKTAPTGEYLTVGSFMIRGKKNFLPPHPLVMGFGLIFRLDESSLGAHLNERRIRGEEEGLLDAEDSVIEEEVDYISGEEIMEAAVRSDTQTTNLKSGSLSPTDGIAESKDVPCAAFPRGSPSDLPEFVLPELPKEVLPNLEVVFDRALSLGPIKLLENNHMEDSLQDASLEEPGPDNNLRTHSNKPYISKAERKKLKKGQKGTAATEERGTNESNEKYASDDLDKDVGNQKSGAKEAESVTNQKSSVNKVTRGRKGKLKKIKERYSEQDDEERRVRMALLASAGKSTNDRKELPQDRKEDLIKERNSIGHDDLSKICYKCKKAGHLSRDCPDHPDAKDNAETTASKRVNSNNTSQHKWKNDLPSNVEESGSTMIEDDDDSHAVAEVEKEKVNDLSYFTGCPLPDDVLFYAVPVCGPYNALQAYKYRVKITPGTLKKGKAAKAAMNLFVHMQDVTVREKELMKACTDPELVAAIIGNVKITAAGLTQLKQRQKKVKKVGKKEDS